ncbi:hypothetical protein Poly51_36260 [Rubripirellula tenax]|uniref:DUF1156 domain-containing protein n=1 Tax=Rubripirellula tenax TaxID=2528015 RepID=A0A5C6F2Q0_9BACT|nr:anti-phage-associated DUF1156 domain-containing protein [Rubripirellula tenax]TWU54904.1 hypothetical protein Poly51_36260 [Rubripirellula tenax]
MSNKIVPFSLKDAPSLIEKLFPVQKLSAESYKEQMAHIGKTLTSLGSYWKGRKPLILNRACILGCLMPATDNPSQDLIVFEQLMAMDIESLAARWKRDHRPKEILEKLSIKNIRDFFIVEPDGSLPESSPIDWSDEAYEGVAVQWRDDLSKLDQRKLLVKMLPDETYRELVAQVSRPEEVAEIVNDHIWASVNSHLGTNANSFQEVVEQLGVMRFGHRANFADTFAGSGQIPFEAARIGCNSYASDINPIACMLTWGNFNIVGSKSEGIRDLASNQKTLVKDVQREIDQLGIESDGDGWSAKVFLYCFEVRCPQTGWMVPLLPTLVVSVGYHSRVDLIPDPKNKRYEIEVRAIRDAEDMKDAAIGTVRSDGRGADPYLSHSVDGVEHRTKLSTLRGDFRDDSGESGNKLRKWNRSDFVPHKDDLYQERLFAIEWMKPKASGRSFYYEFRSVTKDDLRREKVVEAEVAKHLTEWQSEGFIPDMKIEIGEKTSEPIRTRGWTYWHHLFNPRQLLLGMMVRSRIGQDARLAFGFSQMMNVNSRLSRWNNTRGGGGIVKGVFDNQALNTLSNYGCRGFKYAAPFLTQNFKNFAFVDGVSVTVNAHPCDQIDGMHDIYVTDPPYGDAVKYEEILEFFIAWLRKNPPAEFADWVWDSRRSMAIKGEDEDFRRGMVAAYKRMTECMPDHGIQVIMFTHQSGSIWADMANIVWASGLQVTAAWYVVTETESALRDGNNVKGTVLLVCRKRLGKHKTTRDELAWEIEEEVQSQVESLTGLNQQAKGLYRDENVFEDADIQMAGYAAALRVLTRYSTIDGRDMASESIRPRVKGEITFVDDLIGYAVNTANQCLVPQGVAKSHWDKLMGAERFILKMIDMEARGFKTLDNYQNFAKAFKVRDFQAFMASRRANSARLKSAVELARSEMGEGSELHQSVLRAVLYAVMELTGDIEGDDVLAHLTMNVPNWFGDMNQREMAREFADYLAKRLEEVRPEEAASARVLRDLIRNQRIG